MSQYSALNEMSIVWSLTNTPVVQTAKTESRFLYAKILLVLDTPFLNLLYGKDEMADCL